MKRLLPFLTAIAVLGAWPAVSSASTFKGVVVAHEGSHVLVASPSGVVRSFAGHASVGSRVDASGGSLDVVGRSHTAHLRGVVVRRRGATMFLSSNRHLLAVQDTTPSTPTPTQGQVVSSTVAIGSNGQLDDEEDTSLGQTQSGSLQLQAVVANVGNGTVTLTVNGQTLTLPLPVGLTLPASLIGQTVTITVDLGGQNGEDNGGDNGGDGGDGGGDG